jgi:GT2 family glycosyltransferase
MTKPLTVSVVIVSRHRPDALRRAILGVVQQSYRPLELVIVADPQSCLSLRSVPQALHAKIVPYDEANISAARNLGIKAAAGEIVAFVDDDAVPEPSWLRFLIDPFADPEVMVAGGFVRGRNGISWQSRGQAVDHTGMTRPLDIDDNRAPIFEPSPDLAIKTEGTNMAVRRDALVALGGFDPRYRFYLDETDLNLRVVGNGWATALVPTAQVHHGFEQSSRRRQDRVPRSLFEIGASWAVFLATHCEAAQIPIVWERVCRSERSRLLRHMVSGALEPRDVRRLLAGLYEGFEDGQNRGVEKTDLGDAISADFSGLPDFPTAGTEMISGRNWSRRRLAHKATGAVAAGHRANVFCFSPTALYHRVRFTDAGYWLQDGGLFGRSERSQPIFRYHSFQGRVAAETRRVALVREITPKTS